MLIPFRVPTAYRFHLFGKGYREYQWGFRIWHMLCRALGCGWVWARACDVNSSRGCSIFNRRAFGTDSTGPGPGLKPSVQICIGVAEWTVDSVVLRSRQLHSLEQHSPTRKLWQAP